MEKRRFQTHLDDKGREVLSDVPIAIPVGMKKPETLAEQVSRLVGTSILAQRGEDVDDDLLDFEVEEDPEWYSPHELMLDPVLGVELTAHEVHNNQLAYKEAFLKKAAITAKADIPDVDQPVVVDEPEKQAEKSSKEE